MLHEIEPIVSQEAMDMFTTSSKHYVKTAGSTSLHSVPDLNSAERFKVLCLVFRKTSFWPWKKAKIKPTLVTLNDILSQAIDTKPFLTTHVITENYKDTPSFSADGDVGAKIASELDIDLSTTDKFSINVNFGDIIKTEVNWESLERELAKSVVNADHEIFKELSKKKRTTLCVVLESLACKKEGELSEESDLTGKGKVGATVPTSVSVDVHMTGELEKKSHFSYDIPSNTVIAFSSTKLNLNELGKLSMHVGVDKVDNLDAEIASKVDRSVQIKNELSGILSSKNFSVIKDSFREILNSPKCLDDFLELISTAFCVVEEGISFSLSAKELSEQFSSVKGWQNFLKLLGFSIPESMENGKVEFPRNDPEKLMHGSWALLEALSELSEKDISLFLKCNGENKEMILSALSNALADKDTPYSEVGKIIDKDSDEKEFLTNLKFIVMENNDGKYLKYQGQSHHRITDAYIMVYGLL